MSKEKHYLETVSWGIVPITSYQGVLVTRLIGGYSVLNQKVKTPQEVDEVIKKGYENLGSTIFKFNQHSTPDTK
jgi:hypothetical protein